jgi:hypothetical protein
VNTWGLLIFGEGGYETFGKFVDGGKFWLDNDSGGLEIRRLNYAHFRMKGEEDGRKANCSSLY